MKLHKNIYSFIPLIIFLGIWELFSEISPRNSFLFSSPSKVLEVLLEKIITGELVIHTSITAFEATIGLLLGLFVGSITGFLFLYFPKISKISKYYLIALSSIPIYALAPMMIIWFGTGLEMKIAMAFFATVFIAVWQAYEGGQNVNKQYHDFFTLNGATKKQKFKMLILPFSIEWLLQSLKINSGLAILGAFIGEFIASEKGLGYIILKASGLYDVSYVLAATLCIIFLAVFFNWITGMIEKNKLKIIRKISLEKYYKGIRSR